MQDYSLSTWERDTPDSHAGYPDPWAGKCSTRRKSQERIRQNLVTRLAGLLMDTAATGASRHGAQRIRLHSSAVARFSRPLGSDLARQDRIEPCSRGTVSASLRSTNSLAQLHRTTYASVVLSSKLAFDQCHLDSTPSADIATSAWLASMHHDDSA